MATKYSIINSDTDYVLNDADFAIVTVFVGSTPSDNLAEIQGFAQSSKITDFSKGFIASVAAQAYPVVGYSNRITLTFSVPKGYHYGFSISAPKAYPTAHVKVLKFDQDEDIDLCAYETKSIKLNAANTWEEIPALEISGQWATTLVRNNFAILSLEIPTVTGGAANSTVEFKIEGKLGIPRKLIPLGYSKTTVVATGQNFPVTINVPGVYAKLASLDFWESIKIKWRSSDVNTHILAPNLIDDNPTNYHPPIATHRIDFGTKLG